MLMLDWESPKKERLIMMPDSHLLRRVRKEEM